MISHFLCYCHRHTITMVYIVIVMFVAWMPQQSEQTKTYIGMSVFNSRFSQRMAKVESCMHVPHFILELFLPWKEKHLEEETYLQLQHMVYMAM